MVTLLGLQNYTYTMFQKYLVVLYSFTTQHLVGLFVNCTLKAFPSKPEKSKIRVHNLTSNQVRLLYVRS